MGTFRLSCLAEADLIGTSNYSLRTWGADRAIRYIDSLEACCQRLADNLELGRLCEHIRPDSRRLEHARHVVSYRIEAGGILISRILHRRRLPEGQIIDEEEFDQVVE
ncbi:MAG: type II toxin-antitoxin system RelE/ParE family toxin [Gemmatimonadaceae bacterium]|nr:type II toxin-antitoxin system RelE/ParE family toxin [Gloeobacterales cyanobacterium ES-bin-141]